MNKADVARILTMIYAYERRLEAVGASEVEAWFPLVEDLDFDDARQAVTKHFLNSDRYLTVAKLRQLVAEMRPVAKPLDTVDLQTRVPDADPDDPVAYAKAMREGRWKPKRDREDFPARTLDTAGMGKRVPAVSADEVADDMPRPRRWWLTPWKPSQGSDRDDS